MTPTFIPIHCGVFERMTLPAVDRDELLSMVRLQFEKSLPYPMEETSLGIQILSQTETETTLMACAVHEAALQKPDAVPERMTFRAMHLALQADSACALWQEDDRLVFGIFENRRLGFVEILPDPDNPLAELPGVLLRAQMAGANFSAILLDPRLQSLREPLKTFFNLPIQLLDDQIRPLEDDIDLTPASWHQETARKERKHLMRRRIIGAAVAYVVVLLGFMVWLGFQSHRLGILNRECAKLQPQFDALLDRQALQTALAPAIQPKLYTVETLHQVWSSLPSADTHITRFECTPEQFTIEGEAPNAHQAIEFVEKLKRQLPEHRIESAPPILLPNEHAQFRIFGKP